MHRVAAVAVALLAAAAGTTACGGTDAPTEPTPAPQPSPAALSYLHMVLTLMEEHSVWQHEIDWPAFRAAAVARLGAAQTIADAYPAVVATVEELGEPHSRFHPPSSVPNPAPTDLPPSPESIVTGRRFGDLAYVHVPGFGGPNPTGRVDSTLAVLRALDDAEPAPPCGWIVDLRLNTGGNMYPMIAGLGPLLGDGYAGGFVDPDGRLTRWYHREGTAGAGGGAPYATATTPYTLRRPGAPVAVLYGELTASAGEATAISFRVLPRARSFGTETRGASTAPRGFLLSDGALLRLAVASMADRHGTVYGRRVAPDEPVPAAGRPVPGEVDATVAAAQRWLEEQPACAMNGAAS